MKGVLLGTISELQATSYFISNGYMVSKPITNHWEYDLVVDNGILSRVQVKTIYWDKNKKKYILSCANSQYNRSSELKTWKRKKYSLTSFDILAAVEPILNVIYLLPINIVANRNSIILHPDGNIPIIQAGNFISKHDYEKYKITPTLPLDTSTDVST